MSGQEVQEEDGGGKSSQTPGSGSGQQWHQTGPRLSHPLILQKQQLVKQHLPRIKRLILSYLNGKAQQDLNLVLPEFGLTVGEVVVYLTLLDREPGKLLGAATKK